MSNEVQQPRQVLVYCPSAQNRQIQFQTFATNYGELKQDMIANGITDLDKMKVIEGRTQLEFATNQSVLPSNISTRNGVTNDLVLVLTPSKINNGANYTRQEIYAALKKYRSVSKEADKKVKSYFGNYTQLSNNELNIMYHNFMAGRNNTATPAQTTVKTNTPTSNDTNAVLQNEIEAIKESVGEIVSGFIYMYDNITCQLASVITEVAQSYTDEFNALVNQLIKMNINVDKKVNMQTDKQSQPENNNFDDFSMTDAKNLADAIARKV